jgi:hypothetical protein
MVGCLEPRKLLNNGWLPASLNSNAIGLYATCAILPDWFCSNGSPWPKNVNRTSDLRGRFYTPMRISPINDLLSFY